MVVAFFAAEGADMGIRPAAADGAARGGERGSRAESDSLLRVVEKRHGASAGQVFSRATNFGDYHLISGVDCSSVGKGRKKGSVSDLG